MTIIKVGRGTIKQIVSELGYSYNTVWAALQGKGSEFSDKVQKSRTRALELGGKEVRIVEIKRK